MEEISLRRIKNKIEKLKIKVWYYIQSNDTTHTNRKNINESYNLLYYKTADNKSEYLKLKDILQNYGMQCSKIH